MPTTAASLQMQLFKSRQEYYVQVFYRRDDSENLAPIYIPRCGVKCALDKLYELFDEILPNDSDTYESLCRL